MKKYKVIGYEHRSGISKKTQKPYDMDILHVIHDEPIVGEGSYGNRVESLVFNRLIHGAFPAMPLVGDTIGVYFDRFGYPCDIVPIVQE